MRSMNRHWVTPALVERCAIPGLNKKVQTTCRRSAARDCGMVDRRVAAGCLRRPEIGGCHVRREPARIPRASPTLRDSACTRSRDRSSCLAAWVPIHVPARCCASFSSRRAPGGVPPRLVDRLSTLLHCVHCAAGLGLSSGRLRGRRECTMQAIMRRR